MAADALTQLIHGVITALGLSAVGFATTDEIKEEDLPNTYDECIKWADIYEGKGDTWMESDYGALPNYGFAFDCYKKVEACQKRQKN